MPPSWIGIGTEAIMAGLTFAMCILTTWMGWETRRMATISKAGFSLQTRPYLTLKEILLRFFVDTEDRPQGTKVGVRLGNIGNIPLIYRVTSYRVIVDGEVLAESLTPGPGGMLGQGETAVYWYPHFDTDPFPISGVLEYSIEYYSMDRREFYRTQRKLQYEALSGKDGTSQVDWIYLNQSDDDDTGPHEWSTRADDQRILSKGRKGLPLLHENKRD